VRLTDLRPGERIRINAEVTLSRCNHKDVIGQSGDRDTTPCLPLRGNEYSYTPNFSTAIVLGTSPVDASGPLISDWYEQRCPQRRHHCARALDELMSDPGMLPGSGEVHVNLVVTADANGSRARPIDVMEVEQQHGGLHVLRLAPGVAAVPDATVTHQLRAATIPIDRVDSNRGVAGESRRAVYVARLDGLRAGDVVEATGLFHGELGGYSVDPLITSQLLLVADPNQVRLGDADDGPYDRALIARNGHNCYRAGAICSYADSGAVYVPPDAPSTMYLSLVGSAARSDAARNGRNRVKLRARNGSRDGYLSVRVWR
jgi:hypothetical protein